MKRKLSAADPALRARLRLPSTPYCSESHGVASLSLHRQRSTRPCVEGARIDRNEPSHEGAPIHSHPEGGPDGARRANILRCSRWLNARPRFWHRGSFVVLVGGVTGESIRRVVWSGVPAVSPLPSLDLTVQRPVPLTCARNRECTKSAKLPNQCFSRKTGHAVEARLATYP